MIVKSMSTISTIILYRVDKKNLLQFALDAIDQHGNPTKSLTIILPSKKLCVKSISRTFVQIMSSHQEVLSLFLGRNQLQHIRIYVYVICTYAKLRGRNTPFSSLLIFSMSKLFGFLSCTCFHQLYYTTVSFQNK